MSYKRTNPEVLDVGINNEDDDSETYRIWSIGMLSHSVKMRH